MNVEIAFVSTPLKTRLLACTLPYFPRTLLLQKVFLLCSDLNIIAK